MQNQKGITFVIYLINFGRENKIKFYILIFSLYYHVIMMIYNFGYGYN